MAQKNGFLRDTMFLGHPNLLLILAGQEGRTDYIDECEHAKSDLIPKAGEGNRTLVAGLEGRCIKPLCYTRDTIGY